MGRLLSGLALLALLLVACEDRANKNAAPGTAEPAVEPAAAPPPPKPSGPPDFVIQADGPKVGWTVIAIQKPDARERLAKEISEHEEHVRGKDVALGIDRKAKGIWVTQMMSALAEAGATAFVVTTKTRPEFPESVRFVPYDSVRDAAPCSVVAKVLSERRNAVWHLKGGTAVRSPKGLAGPDMAMTAANLARAAKSCKGSDTVFVSADEDVEWGLTYDLAAATQTLEDVQLTKVALLPDPPIAGRKVELR